MRWLKKIFHPLIAFIGLQIIWILLVVFWIIWFVNRHKEFRELAKQYQFEVVGHSLDWLVLVEGLVLLVAVLIGIYVLFLYWRRQSTLYRHQQDAITQITHELKSPLASIQLHLETIQLRKPPPDKQERFLDIMLSDTERLNNLINNLLLAAKLERRRRYSSYTAVDFSEFLSKVMEQKRLELPEGGVLNTSIEPGIKIAIDTEEFQTVLRNLYENALLYSTDAPDIRVELKRDGRQCHIVFQDKGVGIALEDQKKVFQKFYRVRRPGESVRGSGLGLYIVKSVVTEYGGKISLASDGHGKGCTFTITLPIAK
jgi:signal transduction histidine kinase